MVSSSVVLSSVVWLAILLDIRIPTPPPVLFFQFFPIHLYPLILAVTLLVSFDSEIRAKSIFSACSSRVCRLFVFPFRPLVLIFATISFLFFLILGLLCFLS